MLFEFHMPPPQPYKFWHEELAYQDRQSRRAGAATKKKRKNRRLNKRKK